MVTLEQLAQSPPPSRENLVERLSAALKEGGEPNRELFLGLLDIDRATLDRLETDQDGLLLAWGRNSWPLGHSLNFAISTSDRSVFISDQERGTTSVLRQINSLVSELAGEKSCYINIVTSPFADHPVFHSLPAGWLTIHLPVNNDHLNQRFSYQSFRFKAATNSAPDSSWRALPGNIGWIKGNQVRLRFNPFLGGNDRLTMAQPERRRQALDALLDTLLAEAGHEIVRDPLPPPYLDQWRQLTQWGISFIPMVQPPESLLSGSQEELEITIQAKREEIATLKGRLEESERSLRRSEAEISSLPTIIEARQYYLADNLTQLFQQINQIEDMAQIEQINYRPRSQEIEIKTKDMVVDCGNNYRCYTEGVAIQLTLEASDTSIRISNPQRPHQRPHPAAVRADRYYSWTMPWADAAIPLAQALGNNNLAGVVAIICGILIHPDQHYIDSSNFMASQDNPGFVD